jgi:hypothetical protein
VDTNDDPIPLDIDFLMDTSSEDICESAVWAKVNAGLQLEYCTTGSNGHVISNRMITSKIIR